jgi:hypothetical protein
VAKVAEIDQEDKRGKFRCEVMAACIGVIGNIYLWGYTLHRVWHINRV